MPYHHLLTPEGEKLLEQLAENPDFCPWNRYPRPQLQRDSFFCLNGKWSFHAGDPSDTPEETILVPFPPESRLSGIHRHMGKDPTLYYKRSFCLPEAFMRDRVLLHFGAVDQTARVMLNGQELGEHRGGYEAFTFDITEHLLAENTLEVYVTDKLSDRILPYGKQCEKRGGMWYTPISGIWQSVWLESIPNEYIRRLSVIPAADSVHISADGISSGEICMETPEGTVHSSLQNGSADIRIPSPRHWSPEDPYLYRFTLHAGADTVHSYFALRTLGIREVNGKIVICLNGKPYFFHGLLDQGYVSDGIFTPADPSVYTQDIETVKSMGFNMLRKHIKVEPECFYYDCDRLGIVVFQDMVNNGTYHFLRDTALPTVGIRRLPDKWMHRNPARRKAFAESMKNTVRQLYNHPCICCWTIFNEGWGQFDGASMYRKLQELDASRIIDTASGWFAGVPTDVESIHVYFRPVRIRNCKKPYVLSEFGGYSCKIQDHSFDPDKTYGYRYFEDQFAFENALTALYVDEILPAVKKGLCAAVYTQLSDVEEETNGLLTYDRKVCKVSAERMRMIAEKLYEAVYSR